MKDFGFSTVSSIVITLEHFCDLKKNYFHSEMSQELSFNWLQNYSFESSISYKLVFDACLWRSIKPNLNRKYTIIYCSLHLGKTKLKIKILFLVPRLTEPWCNEFKIIALKLNRRHDWHLISNIVFNLMDRQSTHLKIL